MVQPAIGALTSKEAIVRMSAEQMNRPMGIIPIILGVMLCISLAIHVWLYFRVTESNQSVAGAKAELEGIRQEYDTLTLKIMEGNETLSALQRENALAEIRISAMEMVAYKKPQAGTHPQAEDRSNTRTTQDNAGIQAKTDSEDVHKGNTTGGGYPDWDKNGNGIHDDLEEYYIGDDGISTESNPNLRLHAPGE